MTQKIPQFFNTKKILVRTVAPTPPTAASPTALFAPAVLAIPILAGLLALAPASPTFAASPASDALKDTNLKSCVLETYNRDNGTNLKKLTAKQLSSIVNLNCDGRGIKNTAGLERLTKLTSLSLASNNISSIDLAKNTKLTFLNLSRNSLKTLNITKQTKLTELYVHRNNLTELDVRKNKSLSTLFADDILLNTNATASQAGSIYVLDLEKVPFFHASSHLYTNDPYDYMDNLRLLATKDRKSLNTMMTKGTGFPYSLGATYRLKLPSASNVSMNTVAKQLVKMYKDHATSFAQLVVYLNRYGITEPQTRSAADSLKVNYGRKAMLSDISKLLGYYMGKNMRS